MDSLRLKPGLLDLDGRHRRTLLRVVEHLPLGHRHGASRRCGRRCARQVVDDGGETNQTARICGLI